MRPNLVWLVGALVLAPALLIVAMQGCSSNGSTSPATDTGTEETETATDPDADDAGDGGVDARSETYPAFRPTLPKVTNPSGNPVLSDFTVVPVTFAGDTLGASVPDFLAKYVASPEWTAQVKEYGVGKVTMAPAITLSEPAPSAIDDKDVQLWLRAKLDGTHPEWGPTDWPTLAKTVFVLSYPSTTTITMKGTKSCVAFRGFHSAATAPTVDGGTADVGDAPDVTEGGISPEVPIIYVVVPRCTIAGLTEAQTLTTGVAHELTEAATSPLTGVLKPGFNTVDPNHYIWRVALGGGEIADMCNVQGTFWAPPSIGFSIARSWSNLAAAALNDPCVPSPPDEPYFNSYIEPTFTFNLYASGTTITKGIRVAVGATGTFDVLLFSDRPTSGPWDVAEVREIPVLASSPKVLTLALDGKGGSNGDTLHLTITVNDTTPSGSSAIGIYSKLGTKQTVWYTPIALR
jgi:hypothetical protein